MLVKDLLGLSFHNLLLHKVRSILTSLGIIFGVGSVIAMLSISEGARKESLAQIEAMGIDNILLYSQKPLEENTQDATASSIMTVFGLKDVDLINIKKMENIKGVACIKNMRKKILKATTNLDTKLVATDISFLEYTNSTILKGRWLNKIDFDKRSQSCVIGKDVVKKLYSFGELEILNSNIVINNAMFRVVGIMKNDAAMKLGDLNNLNNLIYIPFSTANAIFGKTSFTRSGRRSVAVVKVDYDAIIVKVENELFIENTANRIKRYLSTTHTAKDWGIFIPLSLFKQKEATQKIFTIVMASIAGISLLVGGVGIMNIMLASVFERRKEIGTRLALGAKRINILSQFLAETVILTFLGSFMGLLMGVGLSMTISYYAKWPIQFSGFSIVLSITIAGITGIVFGTYPAWIAAKQNPIDVLRSE